MKHKWSRHKDLFSFYISQGFLFHFVVYAHSFAIIVDGSDDGGGGVIVLVMLHIHKKTKSLFLLL